MSRALAAEQRVDLRLLRGKRAVGGGQGGAPHGPGIAGFAQPGLERGPLRLGQVDVREPGVDRVARAHAGGRGAEILAQPPRRARQQTGAADVRHETDSAFRHGDLRAVARDPMAAMPAEPDTAAHDETVQEADDRLGVFGQLGVEAVFVAPELASVFMVARFAGAVERGDVAARAEGAFALGIQQDQVDGIVVAPAVQRGLGFEAHLVGQRIERPGPGQGDAARAALCADVDVGHGRLRLLWANFFEEICRQRFSMSRATIRRMISFVPSRIWCTRRSRTSFSIP
jgi:hypothetical protein